MAARVQIRRSNHADRTADQQATPWLDVPRGDDAPEPRASCWATEKLAGNAAAWPANKIAPWEGGAHAGDARPSGPGRTLDAGVRDAMESRFGADFSSVRVHVDDHATNALDAEAYTVGSDIVFAPGNDRFDTREGTHRLAHELTHVLQQSQGAVDGTDVGGVSVSDPSDRFEQAAESTADAVIGGGSVSVGGAATASAGASVQRKSKGGRITNAICGDTGDSAIEMLPEGKPREAGNLTRDGYCTATDLTYGVKEMLEAGFDAAKKRFAATGSLPGAINSGIDKTLDAAATGKNAVVSPIAGLLGSAKDLLFPPSDRPSMGRKFVEKPADFGYVGKGIASDADRCMGPTASMGDPLCAIGRGLGANISRVENLLKGNNNLLTPEAHARAEAYIDEMNQKQALDTIRETNQTMDQVAAVANANATVDAAAARANAAAKKQQATPASDDPASMTGSDDRGAT